MHSEVSVVTVAARCLVDKDVRQGLEDLQGDQIPGLAGETHNLHVLEWARLAVSDHHSQHQEDNLEVLGGKTTTAIDLDGMVMGTE